MTDEHWTSKYKVDVPEGKSGAWEVSRFTVNREAALFESLRAAFGSGGGRGVPEGTYTRLARGHTIVMSDTPDEIRDHTHFIHQAQGRVLVAGLGLGMVAQALLQKPEVEHLTIVEQSGDVIQLVGPWLTAKSPGRVTIVQADILTWEPPSGERWDWGWFGIFDEISADNLPVMHRLARRFGRRVRHKGFWAKEMCERQRHDAKAWYSR